MKKYITFILLFVLLVSIQSSAQDATKISLTANKLVVYDTATEQYYSEDINMNIILTDYYLKFSTGRKWTVQSEALVGSDNTFYVYAYDDIAKSRCRIWFKTIDGNKWQIVFEYSDYEFYYECKLNYIK